MHQTASTECSGTKKRGTKAENVTKNHENKTSI
jgi:hypothetical protein